MTTPIDQSRQTLAQILGEEDIRVVEPRWLQLMREGVVVAIHLRRWRARAKLTFADLGLPINDDREREAFDDLLHLGEKLLLPAKCIRDSFAYEVDLSYVPLPSLLAEDLAEAERIQAQREVERLEEELQRDSLWREIRLEEEAARERQRMLAAMNRDVVEKARRQKQELIDGFLTDLVRQLRGLVYEATTDVLAGIQDRGRLHPRSVVQLKNLIDQVANLNFFGDADIDRMIAQVRIELDKAPPDRDIREIQDRLRDIAVVTRATLIGLGEQRARRTTYSSHSW